MIKTFKNKGLAELWSSGKTAKIDARMQERILVRLDRLDVVTTLKELGTIGFNFHALKGFEPTRFSIHVNGPWCLTFDFDGEDVLQIDFEQYY